VGGGGGGTSWANRADAPRLKAMGSAQRKWRNIFN
jgi:hypothetical protein